MSQENPISKQPLIRHVNRQQLSWRAVDVRLALSRWPRALTDDPASRQSNHFTFLVMLLIVSLVVAIPLVVVLATRNRRKLLSDWRYSSHIAAFAIGLLVLWILINRDPGNVWYWYFD
jgi:uncharacterized membrane protein